MILPKRKHFVTPRILLADAYTAGSDKFQSEKAKEKSTYYVVFRKKLFSINPSLYTQGDDRIIFAGLSRILEKLFYDPITHAEIDEAKRFLASARATTTGLKSYYFPEHLWRRIVDEFNGRPPIEILAMPEGSVVYPNEPVIQITSLVDGFGELAAWFESKLLHVWAASERVTQDQHFFKYMLEMIYEVEPDLDKETAYFYASLMVADFGDRAGIVAEESAELGMWHLMTWAGTDTFTGAYQAWKNSNETPLGSSVYALAHRNVQAYEFEGDCYDAMYNLADNGDIMSMVSDCYAFKPAIKNHILRLALRSKAEGTGKVVVGRPDSGDALEQVIWMCELAVEHGLYTERVINGKTWKFATFLKFIEADGMDFKTMKTIIRALLDKGFAPYSWGLFGCGGGLRNGLKRDNLSAKYALCAMGNDNQSVVKFSEVFGKTTLPGPFKVLRDEDSLRNKKTIVFQDEEGINAMIEFFYGTRLDKPFGVGQDEDFLVWKQRTKDQFSTMPLSLETEENHNYPASDSILERRLELLKKYAPSRDTTNYTVAA